MEILKQGQYSAAAGRKAGADHFRRHRAASWTICRWSSAAHSKQELYTFVENAHPALLDADSREEDAGRRAEGRAAERHEGIQGALRDRGDSRPQAHMPSLIDIRRRIRSVKNTQQITKAMKMVSAAKLRRAQDRVIAARPYATLLRQMLANVAAAAATDERAASNPLLARAAREAHPAAADHRRQRAGRRVQLQPDQSGAALRRRASRTPKSRFEADRPQGPRLSSASAARRSSGEHIGMLRQRRSSRTPRRSRRKLIERFRERRDRRGLPAQQRIQERDVADS